MSFPSFESVSVGTSAIKCWVCRSDGDPKCADPFDNRSFPITDCKQEKPRDHLPGLESTMCRKVRQKGEEKRTTCRGKIFCN